MCTTLHDFDQALSDEFLVVVRITSTVSALNDLIILSKRYSKNGLKKSLKFSLEYKFHRKHCKLILKNWLLIKESYRKR